MDDSISDVLSENIGFHYYIFYLILYFEINLSTTLDDIVTYSVKSTYRPRKTTPKQAGN